MIDNCVFKEIYVLNWVTGYISNFIYNILNLAETEETIAVIQKKNCSHKQRGSFVIMYLLPTQDFLLAFLKQLKLFQHCELHSQTSLTPGLLILFRVPFLDFYHNVTWGKDIFWTSQKIGIKWSLRSLGSRILWFWIFFGKDYFKYVVFICLLIQQISINLLMQDSSLDKKCTEDGG